MRKRKEEKEDKAGKKGKEEKEEKEEKEDKAGKKGKEEKEEQDEKEEMEELNKPKEELEKGDPESAFAPAAAPLASPMASPAASPASGPAPGPAPGPVFAPATGEASGIDEEPAEPAEPGVNRCDLVYEAEYRRQMDKGRSNEGAKREAKQARYECMGIDYKGPKARRGQTQWWAISFVVGGVLAFIIAGIIVRYRNS